eukprot:gene1633-6169_t
MEGRPHGEGKWLFAHGGEYHGVLKRGKRCGYGVLEYAAAPSDAPPLLFVDRRGPTDGRRASAQADRWTQGERTGRPMDAGRAHRQADGRRASAQADRWTQGERTGRPM